MGHLFLPFDADTQDLQIFGTTTPPFFSRLCFLLLETKQLLIFTMISCFPLSLNLSFLHLCLEIRQGKS